ncbi:MAG: thiamine-phosphate kinase [Pseudomonadales bacterium]
MDEFALIDAFIEAFEVEAPAELVLGPGDDCALLEVGEGEELCVSVDSLVADTHFPAKAPAALVGYRALAVSLSDLAAMGAKPLAFLVGLSAQDIDEDWIGELARGMTRLASPLGVSVAGGNLARGPLNLTVTVLGSVPRSRALRRSGARPGDQVFVSGCLGEARLGLQRARDYRDSDLDALLGAAQGTSLHLLRRYFLPAPRLELGRRLRGLATAAIDLSDGILADLRHICRASKVGARLELARLPLGPGVGLEAASAGDDYELCFTAPAQRAPDLVALSSALGIDITLVGAVVEGAAITCLNADGECVDVEQAGFRHFR